MAKKKADAKKDNRDRSMIPKYAHYQELWDCMASGWPAETVHEYLERRFGAEGLPSVRTLQRWRENHMPKALVIPHKVIQERLKWVNYKVDVLQHLGRLIPILEDRVARAVDQEESTFGGLPLTVTDTATKVYLEALRDWVAAAQDIGVLPAKPPPVIDMSSKTIIADPEVLKDLRETAREIAALQIGGVVVEEKAIRQAGQKKAKKKASKR